MESFHKSVLTISVVVLIISLCILGIFLAKSFLEDSYPPIISDCPDYWDVKYTDGEMKCENNTGINQGKGGAAATTSGGSDSDCLSFPTFVSNTPDVLCNKYTWSKKCNIVWDGVTNNNKACDLG
jgi:hypothetical protein